eukprot:scaffold9692_cov96-Isochrysis_galbana.AAC.9
MARTGAGTGLNRACTGAGLNRARTERGGAKYGPTPRDATAPRRKCQVGRGGGGKGSRRNGAALAGASLFAARVSWGRFLHLARPQPLRDKRIGPSVCRDHGRIQPPPLGAEARLRALGMIAPHPAPLARGCQRCSSQTSRSARIHDSMPDEADRTRSTCASTARCTRDSSACAGQVAAGGSASLAWATRDRRAARLAPPWGSTGNQRHRSEPALRRTCSSVSVASARSVSASSSVPSFVMVYSTRLYSPSMSRNRSKVAKYGIWPERRPAAWAAETGASRRPCSSPARRAARQRTSFTVNRRVKDV